jgi:neuromedin U receptor 2
VGIVWGFSIAFSLPNTSIHGIKLHYFPNGSLVPGSATCTVTKPMWIYNFIIQVTSFIFYILPMTLISVLYFFKGLRVSIQGIRLGADHLFSLAVSSNTNLEMESQDWKGVQRKGE